MSVVFVFLFTGLLLVLLVLMRLDLVLYFITKEKVPEDQSQVGEDEQATQTK
jgi:hypothetical protein